MKLCSFDARSEGQSGDSLSMEGVMLPRGQQKVFDVCPQSELVPVPSLLKR